MSKRYGDRVAVDDLSFTIRPGHVTGFLRPNGAGKTTTMRLMLGLDNPTAGSVTVNGKPFAQVYSAMRDVGALLDAKASAGSPVHAISRRRRPRPAGARRRRVHGARPRRVPGEGLTT